MRTLRARLVLSQLLPLIIIVPLVGLALIYFIETRVLLPSLTRELTGNASLVAEVTQDQTRLWTDPLYAQVLLARVSPRLSARVMLLTSDGRLLASTDPNDLDNLDSYLVHPDLLVALSGQTVRRVYYNQLLQGEALDVWVPVIDPSGVVGVVRMTYGFANILEEFMQLRSSIIVILLLGLVIGAVLGLSLASAIDRPLRKATLAVDALAKGERLEPLKETGPLELRRLAAAVNTLVDQLHNLEESRRRLLANLVHELGRPLGALRSATQALQKGALKDPELTNDLLGGMEGELGHLQSLLGELTQLYDRVLGKLELNLQPLDLNAWLPQVLAPWESAAREHGLNWEVAIAKNTPLIQADPLRLSQTVGNLLSNAVKFTPAGGTISMEVGYTQQEVTITVSDTGPGIPLEELTKIFTPFYRGAQGKRFVEGMGLGLSIASDIIQAHGGTLKAIDPGRQGARFVIKLPLP
jgi:two-component system, OmpR family, sensor histidine kinase BaeS